MVAFIDDHRADYGVEPICKVLPMAPSTYYAAKARETDPALRSARSQRDEALRVEIQRAWDESRYVYGAKKVWKQLRREGFVVARCTVARLMRGTGLRGVVRGRRVQTTVPADLAERPLDFVKRDFTAERLSHHSDRGVQYLSIRYTERLAEAGIEPSVGSRGDSYDNALAETVIGQFKTEVIQRYLDMAPLHALFYQPTGFAT